MRTGVLLIGVGVLGMVALLAADRGLVTRVAASDSSVAGVLVRDLDEEGGLAAAAEQPSLRLDAEAWRQRLSPAAFHILREKGTERPFTSDLLDVKGDGVFVCAGCRLPLYASAAKFDSGTGWPSFYEPIAAENVGEVADRSYGMVRTEIVCRRCDGHLGHVFDDGPPPTGLRHCVNGLALQFVPAERLGAFAREARPATGPAEAR